MTNEQKSVRDWMKAFGQETPEKPVIPSLEIRKLRAKLILEEALETICALGFEYRRGGNPVENFFKIADELPPNLTEIADGCEDLKVVTEGTLVACGLVKKDKLEYDNAGCWSGTDSLFDEVMRSNNSKMWTRDELNIHFNGDIGAFNKTGTKQLDDWTITIVPIKAAFGDKCFIVIDRDGKVIKSPSYSPANLKPIIEEMAK